MLGSAVTAIWGNILWWPSVPVWGKWPQGWVGVLNEEDPEVERKMI